MQFPSKKQDGLTVQNIGAEVVLFHETGDKAICLNRVSATIWNLCDGHMSVAAIAEAASAELKTPVNEEVVQYALRELRQKGLLEESVLPMSLGPMVSRRAMVQKLGKSAAILLPIAGFVAIPKKAHASGGCVLADTSIQLADGGMIRADMVASGMWLRSFDPDSGEVRDGRVMHVKEFPAPAIHTLFTERGDVLRASPSHLMIAGRGDVHGTEMSKFRAGDSMLVYDALQDCVVASKVTGVQISAVPQTVYGIEMLSDEHTLVTAGVVSHNKLLPM